ncbi:hypothetical protein T459_08427 [Capsicum annuum]|uniref:Uncharacterized protein n=1 Tax=Capsicum annuum TaxID=4072 RepID=A0A2G2ZWJ5_CAPAN|nr:hypothetical protein T459_08427 [Capsicum annuum]
MLKWHGWRVAHSSADVTLTGVERRAPVNCFKGLHIAKQLYWRLKSQWRRLLSWQRSSVRFTYDAYSYSQNFDDGCSKEHRSPLAPRQRQGTDYTIKLKETESLKERPFSKDGRLTNSDISRDPTVVLDHEPVPPNLHYETMQPPENGQYLECIGINVE